MRLSLTTTFSVRALKNYESTNLAIKMRAKMGYQDVRHVNRSASKLAFGEEYDKLYPGQVHLHLLHNHNKSQMTADYHQPTTVKLHLLKKVNRYEY